MSDSLPPHESQYARPPCPSQTPACEELTMEYYSVRKRNEFESGELRWMNLKSIIQSEVRERKILYINSYMESRKIILMKLFAGQNRDPDIENRLVDTVRGGEGGTNQEKVALKYILYYV